MGEPIWVLEDLINAYRTAAKEAFENANIIEDEDRETVELTFTYEAMPFVMNTVKASDCTILEQDFEESPKLILSVPVSNINLQIQLKSIKGVHIQCR